MSCCSLDTDILLQQCLKLQGYWEAIPCKPSCSQSENHNYKKSLGIKSTMPKVPESLACPLTAQSEPTHDRSFPSLKNGICLLPGTWRSGYSLCPAAGQSWFLPLERSGIYMTWGPECSEGRCCWLKPALRETKVVLEKEITVKNSWKNYPCA